MMDMAGSNGRGREGGKVLAEQQIREGRFVLVFKIMESTKFTLFSLRRKKRMPKLGILVLLSIWPEGDTPQPCPLMTYTYGLWFGRMQHQIQSFRAHK